MDIQNTFYLLGSIFMILGILILIGVVVLLFYVKKKVADLHTFIELRINELTELTVKPVKRAADIARSIIPTTKRTQAARR